MLIDYYSVDFINCLWTSEVVKCGNDGLLLNRLPNKILDDLNDIEDSDKFLDIYHHLAFALDSYIQLSHYDTNINNKSFILKNVISPCYSNISEFIEKVVSVMKNKLL